VNSLNFNFGCVSPTRTWSTSEDKGLIIMLITMQISMPLGRDVYWVHPQLPHLITLGWTELGREWPEQVLGWSLWTCWSIRLSW